jgi:hypothetical protein
MTTLVFDTLSYTKKLKAAGFSEAQARYERVGNLFNIEDESA